MSHICICIPKMPINYFEISHSLVRPSFLFIQLNIFDGYREVCISHQTIIRRSFISTRVFEAEWHGGKADEREGKRLMTDEW